MNRILVREILDREFRLSFRDFHRTPSATCWTRLESCMFAWQWVETRLDAEIVAMIGAIPDDLAPDRIVDTIAEMMRGRLTEIDMATLRDSVRKPPRKAKENRT